MLRATLDFSLSLNLFDRFWNRKLKRCLTEEVVKELLGDAHAAEQIEAEWAQLREDRVALRQIFPTGDSKVRVVWRSGVAARPLYGVSRASWGRRRLPRRCGRILTKIGK